MARIYCDNDVSLQVAVLMRAAGDEVTTASEVGMARATDNQHLLLAFEVVSDLACWNAPAAEQPPLIVRNAFVEERSRGRARGFFLLEKRLACELDRLGDHLIGDIAGPVGGDLLLRDPASHLSQDH